jgi:tetratricopeptide (TPR) repeat protein
VAAHAADSRSRAERFYALVSGARILQLLERNQEALDRLNEAQTIFAGNADLEMQRGIVLYGLRRVEEAERALRQSVEMRPSAQNCAILGQFYAMQKRPHSAITAFRCAAALAPYPARTYITIAQMHLQANDPKAALPELDRAWRHADEAGPDQINRFRADVSEFRGRAYWAMQDSTAAVNAMRQATELDAGNPSRWEHLADLYDAMNRPNEAAQARERAQQLTH